MNHPMTEIEFRENHSRIIEYYQYIEMRLGMICAALLADQEKGWFERLDDYDGDPLGKLIRKTQESQTEKQETWLSPEDFRELDALSQARNFWTHECFKLNHHVCFSKGIVRNQAYAKKLNSDLQNVMEWNEKLTEILRKFHMG